MYSLFLYPQLIDKFMEKSLGNNIQAKQRILYTYIEVLSENDTSGYEQTDSLYGLVIKVLKGHTSLFF